MVSDIVEEATEEEIVARGLEMDVQHLASLKTLSPEAAADIRLTLSQAMEIVERKASSDPVFAAVQKVLAI